VSDTTKYHLGQQVYFVGTEKFGVVTGILYRAHGVCYLVTWATDLAERYHSDIELSLEKSFVDSTG
jgi:hypothetical protein